MSPTTTRITVADDGRICAAAPLPVGRHRVRVEVSDHPPVQQPSEPLDVGTLSVIDRGPWPWHPDTTFSREEIYGDDGR